MVYSLIKGIFYSDKMQNILYDDGGSDSQNWLAEFLESMKRDFDDFENNCNNQNKERNKQFLCNLLVSLAETYYRMISRSVPQGDLNKAKRMFKIAKLKYELIYLLPIYSSNLLN